MQIVFYGLIDKPDVALIAGAAPVMVGALFPAVEDRLVLALVVGTAEREGVLGPDDKRGPLAARLLERLLQPVELRRRHADVDGALGQRQKIDAGIVEQRAEVLAERVVK